MESSAKKQNENPHSLPINPDAMLWAVALLGESKGVPAATVAPLALGLAPRLHLKHLDLVIERPYHAVECGQDIVVLTQSVLEHGEVVQPELADAPFSLVG